MSDAALTSARTGRSERVLRWWYRALLAVLAVGPFLVLGTANRRTLPLAILAPLTFLPFTWCRRRLQATIDEARPALATPWLVAGTLLDAIMVVQLLDARAPARVEWLQAPGVTWVGTVWFSAHALLGLAYLLGGLTKLLRRFLPTPTGFSPGRRAFLGQAGLAGAVVPFAASLSGVRTSYDFQVEEREVFLPGLPRSLDGLRVAHLSDIHVGGLMNRERLRRVAELTNGAKPDLVLHTGDFLTHRPGDFDLPLYEALATIRAPLGQWACLGNHDYDRVDLFVRRLADAGVTTLRDRSDRLTVGGDRLEVVGFDFRSMRQDRETIYRDLVDGLGPAEGARLLLNHDPSGFSDLPTNAADLVLSGHTHGGHIGFQVGPTTAVSVVGMVGLRDQGFYRRDGMQLYITRCVGFYGYPMRIGIAPEIALLTLRSGPIQEV